MTTKYAKNPLYQNLWPFTYDQKIGLENGKNVLIKRRKESDPTSIITLYAEEVGTGNIMGVAGLYGSPDNTEFSIQIEAQYRGQGLGKKFFKTLVALARTLGITAFTHRPITLPPRHIIEKWEKTKWMQLEYTPQGQVRIHCLLNQKMGF